MPPTRESRVSTAPAPALPRTQNAVEQRRANIRRRLQELHARMNAWIVQICRALPPGTDARAVLMFLTDSSPESMRAMRIIQALMDDAFDARWYGPRCITSYDADADVHVTINVLRANQLSALVSWDTEAYGRVGCRFIVNIGNSVLADLGNGQYVRMARVQDETVYEENLSSIERSARTHVHSFYSRASELFECLLSMRLL